MTNMLQQYLEMRAARERDLAARAGDPEFRARLIAAPRETLSSVYNVAIPQSADVRVVEDTIDTQYIVLPPAEFSGNAELTEDQLEAVAGGWSIQITATTLCYSST